MNKGAIQRFAIWARNELIAQVSQRAYQYGITKEGCGEANAVTVGGRALTGDEQKQRKELVDQIRSKGYTQVMEEVATLGSTALLPCASWRSTTICPPIFASFPTAPVRSSRRF